MSKFVDDANPGREMVINQDNVTSFMVKEPKDLDTFKDAFDHHNEEIRFSSTRQTIRSVRI